MAEADLGTAVLNEVIMPITRIYLHESQLVVEACGPVDSPAAEGLTEVRLHAPDGSLVMVEEVDVPKCDLMGAAGVTYVFPFEAKGDRWEARSG